MERARGRVMCEGRQGEEERERREARREEGGKGEERAAARNPRLH